MLRIDLDDTGVHWLKEAKDKRDKEKRAEREKRRAELRQKMREEAKKGKSKE